GLSFPGNDRVALAVRDFLHFQLGPLDWAIFNLADSFLVIGAAMLFVQSFQNPDAVKTPAESDESPP
ncbi:MAG: signal peptidase II, partial [Planctomycetaceae bacterium]